MLPDALDLLQNYTFMEILLCIISGKDYSSIIAKTLRKSQPTVTEQLKQLETARLITALKRKKAQAYEVNWDNLFEIFYDTLYDGLKLRENILDESGLKKITRTNIEGIIPRDLFKSFLREYFSSLKDLGGKKKGFDEIIFSFFAAIKNLGSKNWRKLLKQYEIDGKILAYISDKMEFEIYGVEQTSLIMIIDENENQNKEKSAQKSRQKLTK
jgi:hypothetical protein